MRREGKRLTLALLGCVLLAGPTRAAAQLPRHWFDAAIGFADGQPAGYVSGTQIVGEMNVGARLHDTYGLELGLWQTPGIWGGYKVADLCQYVPGSAQCVSDNPKPLSATAVTITAVRDWGADVPGEISIGLGDYVLSRPNDLGSSVRALGIHSSLAGELGWSHGALAFAVRPIFFPNLRGRREWMTQFTAGFRLW